MEMCFWTWLTIQILYYYTNYFSNPKKFSMKICMFLNV